MPRKNPLALDVPKMDKHEQMCADMNSAIYTLSDKIRKPYPREGEKLLPKKLRTSEAPGSKEARKHIERLHRAFRGEQ